MLPGLLAPTCPAHAGDWPCFRGPDHNGISPERDWSTNWPAAGPPILWRTSVGIGFSGISVADGRCFTLGNRKHEDVVWCFDALTGEPRWQNRYPSKLAPQYYEGGPGATPTVDGDRVYTLSKHGRLFCLGAADGQVIWERDLSATLNLHPPRWGFSGSPLISGNLLLLNAGGAGTALDKLTGRPVWTSTTNFPGYATPLPFRPPSGGDQLALIFGAKALHAVRVNDGHAAWRFPWPTRWDINIADPIVAGSRVFISSFEHGGAVLDLSRGKPVPLWRDLSLSNHFSSSVLLNGFLYGVNGNTDIKLRDLRCVEFSTGRIAWKHEGLGLGSLIAAGGRLLILGEHGELVVADPSPLEFRPVARAKILSGRCWTAPTLANGLLYARNSRGRLVCVDLRRKPPPTGP